MRVVVTEAAATELEAVARWWAGQGRGSPMTLVEEFDDACRRLAEGPGIGVRVKSRHHVRRCHLERARYWVYYLVDEDHDVVSVLHVWHTSREGAPDLPR